MYKPFKIQVGDTNSNTRYRYRFKIQAADKNKLKIQVGDKGWRYKLDIHAMLEIYKSYSHVWDTTWKYNKEIHFRNNEIQVCDRCARYNFFLSKSG